MASKAAGQPVTLREVASAAQVSVSTASRALTDGRYVSAEKLERIREAAASIGYQPHEGARSLRSSRTMTIGLVCRDLVSPAMLDLIGGMTAAADDTAYSVFIGNAAGRQANYQMLVRRFFERRVDAILLMNPEDVAKEVTAFTDSGRPVLAALTVGEDCTDLPFVYSDESDAMRDAMRRLCELGHRSLGYLVNPSELRSTRPGFTGEIAREFRVAFTQGSIEREWTPDQVTNSLRDLLRTAGAPTVLVVSHQSLGPLLSAIRRIGLEIPRDLSLLTFSDSMYTDGLTVPSIATIHTDLNAMGSGIIGMLIGALGGGGLPTRTDVALSSWREAESVGPAPVRGASLGTQIA